MGPYTFPNTARARWFFWAVVGLTALAAALRFSTLGLQSYRHDEAVTAGRVLYASLPRTMHEVWAGESTPPLYYLLAWLWSHLFGVREAGLRSLSALFGTATIPLAYLVGRELIGRRAGLPVAAIVAGCSGKNFAAASESAMGLPVRSATAPQSALPTARPP